MSQATTTRTRTRTRTPAPAQLSPIDIYCEERERLAWEAQTVGMVGPTGREYTIAQLRLHYDRVKNHADPRGPIRAEFDECDTEPVALAIEFFTATKAYIWGSPTPGRAQVTAAGYRNGPAGDH
jgi:hypothetical protein